MILQKLLLRGPLRNKSNLVIWHDVISNTINAHHSNYDETCTTTTTTTAEELLEMIEHCDIRPEWTKMQFR